MTRLGDRFQQLQSRNERALVCYVMAGDPSLDKTVEIVHALDDAGVDAIELGVPFSDPLADGPSIQAASQRSLAAGMRVSDVFEVVRRIRKRSEIPIVVMTYCNPAFRYGMARFAADSAESGVDGVIQTDLTPEESGGWIEAARPAGLDTVFLLAPTSTEARIEVVSRLSTGFIYCVSRTGVTGARDAVPADLKAFVYRIKAHSKTPVCVGFGVSRPDHVRQITEFADGVVVGSALVDIIGEHGETANLVDEVRNFAAGLKSATKPPR